MNTYDETATYGVAARPNAEPLDITFGEVRAGDYMTNDGARWVKVVKVKPREVAERHVAGEVSVMFEIPEPVNLRSLETRYWIDRTTDTSVVVDGSARGV